MGIVIIEAANSTAEHAAARQGLPTVYPRRRNYHEERFGWRSGFWIMWDTHPAGTGNALRLASPAVRRRAAYTEIRPRPHDDPCKMQLLPTSHTASARLASPHEAWDSRASRAWQDVVGKFNRAAPPRAPRGSRPAVRAAQGV